MCHGRTCKPVSSEMCSSGASPTPIYRPNAGFDRSTIRHARTCVQLSSPLRSPREHTRQSRKPRERQLVRPRALHNTSPSWVQASRIETSTLRATTQIRCARGSSRHSDDEVYSAEQPPSTSGCLADVSDLVYGAQKLAGSGLYYSNHYLCLRDN